MCTISHCKAWDLKKHKNGHTFKLIMCISFNFYGKMLIFLKKNVCGNKLPVIRCKKLF